MTTAIYPGSFDPITLGHLDIITRIRPLFGNLQVVVANSRRKEYLFSLEERVRLIRENVPESLGVHIESSDGLIVDYAKNVGAKVIVRGLRAVSDFEYEMAIAAMNRKLSPSIETMIVFPRPEYSFLASTMVKEVAFHGGDLNGLVPPNVIAALKDRVQKKGR